jgi:glucose/arabinose dehydrogenase
LLRAGWLLMLGLLSPPALAYRVETVVEGLDHPWSIAFLPDGRLLVTERVGRLRFIDNGTVSDDTIFGLPSVHAAGQGGLFDVVLDPDFAANGVLFLSYAEGDSDANRLRVVRVRLEGEMLFDMEVLFTAKPDKRGDVHYGGRMALLGDGTLAIASGDGFIHRESAQSLDNHLGKIVRVARDGSIPPSNPFASRSGALPEIYSLGHRNPQGLVYDAHSGRLYEHEHGPRGGDELNVIRTGHNYGWPLVSSGIDYTGALVTPFTEMEGLVGSMLQWTPSIAPAGMAIYRGTLFPEWQGSLFVATLAERSVRRIALDDGVPGEQEILFAELGERIRDVRAGPDGALYLLTDASNGKLLRVVP